MLLVPSPGGRAGPANTDAPAVWAADREAGCVLALDADLLPLFSVAAEHPVQLGSAPHGGVWVLEAIDAGSRRLTRLDRHGQRAATELLPGAWELDPDGGLGRALLVREGGGVLVCRTAGGDALQLAPGSRVERVAAGWGAIATGDESGLLVVRADDGALRRRRLGAPIVALHAARDSPGWWLMLGAPAHRVLRLGSQLSASFQLGVPSARLLAPSVAHDEAWLVDGERATLSRVGASGVRFRIRTPELVGARALAATPEDGLLVATSGAILHFGREGDRRPGQGGFRSLVDLAVP